VPVVLALHLFRRRFRPHRVSALFLWIDEDDYPAAGRKRERLRRSSSLWLELLAALLLGLAFAGPKGCNTNQATHLVAVLDASASMGAMAKDETGRAESLRDRAVEILGQRIAELSPRSLVTLIESGPQPHVLAGPAAFAAEALQALDRFQPGCARHTLHASLGLAQQVAGTGRILVLTDNFQPADFPEQVELIAVGEALDNVAITHAARGPGKAGLERVLVSLTAFTREPAGVQLTLLSAGQELQTRTLQLEPRVRKHFAFELPAGAPAIEVRITGDALSIDDRAFLAPLPERSLGLASTLDLEDSLALGLTGGAPGEATLSRLLDLIPHSKQVSPGAAELLITADPAAPAGARTWKLSIEGSRAASELPVDLIGPFLFERGHPLLRGLTLSGVVWSMAPELQLAGTPLVAAGEQVLLSERRGSERRTYHLNLIPHRSSLQRSPDWPILLANLAELRRLELPGPVHPNISVGEPLLYQSHVPGTYELQRLGGGTAINSRALGTLQVEGLSEPGLYELRGAQGHLANYGLSFKDPAESDLRQLASGQVLPETLLSEAHAALGPLETLLLSLALGALLLDWWVLRRASLHNKLEGLE